MRIVFLADRIPPFEIGGGGKIPYLLAKGFLERGHEIHLISSTTEASYHESRDGLSIHYLHSRYPERWRAWLSLDNPQVLRPLRHLLENIKPEVVNAHNIHTHLSYASLSLAHRMGFPVVFSSHDLMPVAYGKVDFFINECIGRVSLTQGSLVPAPTATTLINPEVYRLPPFYNLRQMRFRYNPLRNVLIRRILTKRTHVRVAVSQMLKQALEVNGLPPFRVVNHGFDTQNYIVSSESIEQLRQKFNLAGKKVIFFGGRLTEGKGSRQLLQALNQVVGQVPNVVLLVLSAAPFDRAQLTGNIQEHHICEGGWLSGEALIAAYQLADAVAVPSIYLDPSPTVVFEAMAAGRVPLVSCFSGASEAVIHGKTGFIINPFDTSQFAETLIQLLRDDKMRDEMGTAARQHMQQHFTVDQQLDNMMQAYQDASEGTDAVAATAP